MYIKCLRISQEVLPLNHLNIANIYESFGLTLRNRGAYAEAEEMQRKCLRIRREVLPPNHLDLANIYQSLGVSPKNHLDLASIYENLGLTLGKKGSLEEAENMLMMCLFIRQEVLPPNHLDIQRVSKQMESKGKCLIA